MKYTTFNKSKLCDYNSLTDKAVNKMINSYIIYVACFCVLPHIFFYHANCLNRLDLQFYQVVVREYEIEIKEQGKVITFYLL